MPWPVCTCYTRSILPPGPPATPTQTAAPGPVWGSRTPPEPSPRAAGCTTTAEARDKTGGCRHSAGWGCISRHRSGCISQRRSGCISQRRPPQACYRVCTLPHVGANAWLASKQLYRQACTSALTSWLGIRCSLRSAPQSRAPLGFGRPARDLASVLPDAAPRVDREPDVCGALALGVLQRKAGGLVGAGSVPQAAWRPGKRCGHRPSAARVCLGDHQPRTHLAGDQQK